MAVDRSTEPSCPDVGAGSGGGANGPGPQRLPPLGPHILGPWLSQPLPQYTACPSHAGSGLQRVRPSRRGAGGGRRSAAAESPVLTGGSQAEGADQRPGDVRASYDRPAQGRAEVKCEDFTQLSL